MSKVLLINLPFERMYEGTKLSAILHYSPPLSLAAVGASLLQDKNEVRVFDMNHAKNSLSRLAEEVMSMQPDFVGVTFVTALFKEMLEVVRLIKGINKDIIVIGGGPHVSSFPAATLNESGLDVGIIGEGDLNIREVVNRLPYQRIKGIVYRQNGSVIVNPRESFIKDLDSLPLPAYQLFDITEYKISKTLSRFSPVAWLESSRGCLYNCVYCNKTVHGNQFRTKTPERVIEEMLWVKSLGFKEVHFADDAFTTDINRSKEICDLIISKGIKLPWVLITGIRVNQVDAELFMKLKKAGCYRVAIGVESGNEQILKNIHKGIHLEQVERAVYWSKKAGVEIWGLFMISLPGETEESMRDTIAFAKKLPFDLVKMSIMIPLPATPIFNEWEAKKLIKTKDWSKFSFYSSPAEIYDHPDLSWDVIMKYYDNFYKGFYSNPSFIWRRFKSSIKNGTLLDDITCALQMKWFNRN